MSSPKKFPVFDADSHVLEPSVIWESYLDPEYRSVGKQALWRQETPFGCYTFVNGKTILETANNNIPRQAIWQPGVTWDEIGDLDPMVPHPINEGARDSGVRLRDMDAMGVDQTLLYPTIFAEQFPFLEDPRIAYALARAYNDWVADFCQAAPDRLYAVAVLPLQDMAFALEELARVSKKGCFRAVFLRPAFVQERYLNHPYYEPLWAELEQIQLVAAVHPTPGIQNPEYSCHGPWIEKVKGRMGRSLFGLAQSTSALGHPVAEILAPWFDNSTFLLSIMFYAVLERYPKLRLIMAHGKASWLPVFLEKAATYAAISTVGGTIPMRTDADDVFYESRAAIGFDADEVAVWRMPDRFGSKAVWGSHYPQHDTIDAWQAVDMLTAANVTESMMARMLGENAVELFGTALQHAGLAQPG